ncbi:ATP-binding protein [Lacticaseibacillus manihotivorans]|uniref:ATP-binding protein n=1 Tax=Lacticaseibacillus manihotivorans TaxID=88233 RepID=UPI000B2AED33|nr:ATP-binding protein [Lacticaseibacillus manihotivorans]
MNRHAHYELLVIYEIGYLSIDHDEVNLLFQLINAGYERCSTIYYLQCESIWLGVNLPEPNSDGRHSGSTSTSCSRHQDHSQIRPVERYRLTAKPTLLNQP